MLLLFAVFSVEKQVIRRIWISRRLTHLDEFGLLEVELAMKEVLHIDVGRLDSRGLYSFHPAVVAVLDGLPVRI